MSARLLESCGFCGSQDLQSVVHLGSSPPTCNMVPVGEPRAGEAHYPLELLRCADCTLVQLSVTVDPDEVFPADYPYSSGNSRALHENFEDLAESAQPWLELPGDLVVDIGANDGTLLSKFDDGLRVVGVEPTGQILNINGPRFRAFFTEKLAYRIREEYGPAKVITACNVMAHAEDIHEVMRGVEVLLADDGVLIAENHDLVSVIGGQWDTVYHEHLRFYDPYTFSCLLADYDLGTREWRPIPTHGGSFRTFAEPGGWERGEFPRMRDYDFAKLNREINATRHAIRMATRSGRLWGIGATARATTIINHCGLDVEDIPAIAEVSGSDKIGHYIPGTRIPVVDESELFESRSPGAILFSWHLADSIVPKLRERGYKRPITVPLPTLRYL